MFPPLPKAAVCVPHPQIPFLEVFKLPGLVVQEDPLYSSVAQVIPGISGSCPPKQRPEV